MRTAPVAGLLCVACAACAPANAATPLASPNLPAADTWVPTAGGSIRVLDKQKAQSQLLDLKVGQTVQFESLQITLRACVVHPPILPPDAAGFVAITDNRDGEPGFHGWMLAHEPGVAMLESPVYGVRVTGCEPPTDAAVASALPAAAAPAEPTTALPTTALPGAAAPDADTPATEQSVPLSPAASTPLGDAPADAAPETATVAAPGAGASSGSLVPRSPLAPASPGRPAAPAQPAAPASGGIY